MECKFTPRGSGKKLTDSEYKAYLLNGGLDSFIDGGHISGKAAKDYQQVRDQEGSMDPFERIPGRERDAGLIQHLLDSKHLSEEKKSKLRDKLKYKAASQQEAYDIAKGIVAEFGETESMLLAEAGKFDEDINSAIFAISIDNTKELEDEYARNGRSDLSFEMAQQWAEFVDRYDDFLRGRGRAVAMAAFFYKTSPLGIILREKKRNMDRFKERVEGPNKATFEEMLDAMNSYAEFEEYVNEKVREALATKKPSKAKVQSRSFRKAVSDFFDKLKIDTRTTNSAIIPPQIWNAAMEIMKQLLLAGETIVHAVNEAAKHITKEYGQAWDEESFKKEYKKQLSELYVVQDDSQWKKFAEKLQPKNAPVQKEEKSQLEKINHFLSRANNSQRASILSSVVSYLNDRGIVADEDIAKVVGDAGELAAVLEAMSDDRKDSLLSFVSTLIETDRARRAKEATLSRMKDAVRKQIDSLNAQIAAGQRVVREKPEKITDSELEALRTERDELKRVLDELVGAPNAASLSFEQKLQRAIQAKEKAIERYEKMIAQRELKAEKGEAVSSPELEALDAQLKEKRKEYKRMQEEILESMYPDERPDWYKEKILKRYSDRLKRMNEDQKEEFIRKSLISIVTNGGLNYEEFRQIIAESMGYGDLSQDQQIRVEEFVRKINEVQKAGDRLREERSDEALEALEKAIEEADVAKAQLADALYTKANALKTLQSVMQLNTLGLVSLVMNLSYNVFEQIFVRFPKSLIGTVFENAAWGITMAANKIFGTPIFDPHTNMVMAQKGFFQEGSYGLKEGMRAVRTGAQAKDFFEGESYQSRIQPLKSLKKLRHVARKDMSGEEVFDAIIQATAGWGAEFIARGLTLFDKPMRFAAEGAIANQIAAEELGLKDEMDIEIFKRFPKEEAARIFMAKGMSKDDAAAKAEALLDRIIRAGERAIFQQRNYVSDKVEGLFNTIQRESDSAKGLNKIMVGAAAMMAKSQFLFVKIPTNVMWSAINLANPLLSFAQAAYYIGNAFSKKRQGLNVDTDFENAKYWLYHGALGLAMVQVIGAILPAISGGDDEDEDEKERKLRKTVQRASSLDVIKAYNELFGTNIEGSFFVDLAWFGTAGTLMQIKKVAHDRGLEDALSGEAQGEIEKIFSNLAISAQYGLSAGAFQNSIAALDAWKRGGKVFQNWFVNTMNVYSNILQPATFAQISRSSLGYNYRIADDTFMERVQNNFAARSSLYRLATDYKPPTRITPWGDVEKPFTDGVQGLLFNLFRVDKREGDVFGQVLFEDYQRTQNPQFLPTIPSKQFSIEFKPDPDAAAAGAKPVSKEVELSYEEWDLYQIEVGKMRRQMVEPVLLDQAAVDGKGVYSTLDDNVKLAVLKSLYSKSLELGKLVFISKYPEILDRSPIDTDLKLNLFKKEKE